MVFNNDKFNNFNFFVLEKVSDCISGKDVALLLTNTYLTDFREKIGDLLYEQLFDSMIPSITYGKEGAKIKTEIGMVVYEDDRATTTFNFNPVPHCGWLTIS